MELNRKGFLLAASSTLLIPAESAQARTRPIYYLPKSSSRRFAWTIDDGVSNSAVRAYLDLAEEHNQHLTFFVTSCYSSWRKNSAQIQRLLNAGKIELANHTLSHRDLTKSSDAVVRNQLLECHRFLLNEFGYDARPFFRPTYGYWNQRLINLAAELGYTAPMMWMGTLGDTAHLPAAKTISLANQWIANGRIVVDHANSVKSPAEMSGILKVIQARGLKSVTLREAFGRDFR